MKIHPKRTALLYIKDLLYVGLHPSQIWGVTPRTDGKYELKRGCVTIVLDGDAYDKYFEGRPDPDA